MFKIQCRFSNENQPVPAPADLTEWQDCINLPELPTIEAAQEFLVKMEVTKLETYGLIFQIVPKGS